MINSYIFVSSWLSSAQGPMTMHNECHHNTGSRNGTGVIFTVRPCMTWGHNRVHAHANKVSTCRGPPGAGSGFRPQGAAESRWQRCGHSPPCLAGSSAPPPGLTAHSNTHISATNSAVSCIMSSSLTLRESKTAQPKNLQLIPSDCDSSI